MARISAKWADDTLKRFAADIDRLNREFPRVLPQVVNRVGDRAKTQVIRTLTKQTGLPRKTIVTAIGDPSKARQGRLSYDMVTRGGKIRLKYLAPRETRRGVTAKPRGKRTLFEGAFMKGGRFPNRVTVPQFDGHAMRRLNSSGTKITFARSDMTIPEEMVSDKTPVIFAQVALPLLEERVGKTIAKYLR